MSEVTANHIGFLLILGAMPLHRRAGVVVTSDKCHACDSGPCCCRKPGHFATYAPPRPPKVHPLSRPIYLGPPRNRRERRAQKVAS